MGFGKGFGKSGRKKRQKFVGTLLFPKTAMPFCSSEHGLSNRAIYSSIKDLDVGKKNY
jgi:hypothetical protein